MINYQIHSVKSKEEIIHQVLQVPYQFILFKIDDFFQDISSLINSIRNEMSKNRTALIYLITSDRSNHTYLKKISFDEKTFILDVLEEDESLSTLLEVIPDLIK
ncbi:hypothetical protein [Rickettsiella massiliensis]|uniref:hypothetical protein n=1 Tax=Rickettsiella massiliensis TaxID=676517 RepID=UPI00029A782A|nr:hypothetical protein [Rickettsiella massiliensis]